ncbi:putative DsbA family dithiol-disulfide isomerase [Streptacidiphilus sp. MAP12-16]|uniref:DsbA family oxidoreductase n=1 Tax=Streptacidiphilus sp. MAP12-16 TaxID=3156300 RepID=UPI0035160949
MRVEVWGDIVCPWCYIGKARFEQALAGFEHRDQVVVEYRSFELEPGRDRADIVPVEQMLRSKFGPQGPGMDRRVAELARSEGLDYRTDRQIGNTLDVHRLVHLARERNLQHQFITAAFHANFAQARTLFTTSALSELAPEVGLDTHEVGQVLDDPTAYTAAVRAEEQRAADLGATGVPFFLIDGRHTVSGGQSSDAFTRALHQAWTSRPEASAEEAGVLCSPDGTCEVPTPPDDQQVGRPM